MLRVSDGFVACIIPHTTGLNRLARKHSKWPMAKFSEEGKEENVFAEHTAYKERRVPSTGLRPAEEGLRQL